LKIEPEVQFFNLLNSNAVITSPQRLRHRLQRVIRMAPFLPGGAGGSISSNTPPRVAGANLIRSLRSPGKSGFFAFVPVYLAGSG
jgi:hypothetical protein